MMTTRNPVVTPLMRRSKNDPFDCHPRTRLLPRIGSLLWAMLVLISALAFASLSTPAAASQAWGSINNFDAVNDTGSVCHGFEIEIDGARSKDITYTYDWNHYGVPKITEDLSDPLNPRVFVRYVSAKNPDGTWAAYTAIPSGPINPTDGHQFTNPSVNFGGEHFGVGFYGAPTAIKYSWLKDDGTGNLVFAGAVNIATPSFAYAPPVANIPAQVVAVIIPPPPPAPPPLEFGEASWVKVTVTSSHNNHKVELRDLVSDDPDDPNDRNWKNGEPDEVEVEWQLLQTDFNSADGGANGKMEGKQEELPNGDEVITRRYDFFKYVGPIDQETGEALCESVSPDGIHGQGIKIINGEEVDLSTVVVVGDYIGAQMAGFDAAAQIGLIDHLQDGELNAPYIERTIVVGGTAPILTTRTGDLPDGMVFDEVTGVLSGTPTVTGIFTFTVHSTDAANGDVSATYHLTINDVGIGPPAHINVITSASPPEGGTTSGDGEYLNGVLVTVVATANPGYAFLRWTDGGTEVSTSPSYGFTADVNRELVAVFADITPPTSRVAALPAVQSSLSFDVLWDASDLGSGVRDTTVYVSDNGGPFTAWLVNTPATQATFTGELGHTYAFKSQATDNAGNVEDPHGSADTQTRITVIDISVQIRATSSGLVYNRATQTYYGTITLKNIGTNNAPGPIRAVLTNLTPGVTLVNKSGDYQGAPYLTANVGSLAPGASTTLPVQFKNTSSARIGYAIRAYAGTF